MIALNMLYVIHQSQNWQDLSYGAVIFDLVTLTLKFDLLFLKL